MTSSTYPPQSSLHQALQNQQNQATTNNGESDSNVAEENAQQLTGQHRCGHEHSQEEVETMRLRGGCFDLGLCGCPDCECCIIPCTVM